MNHRLTITAAIATLAASLSLIPLLSGGKWFFGGLGAIIVVAAVGTATRHRALRALPPVVCLLCSLVALVLYLNLVYSSKTSFLHLVPTTSSLYGLWHSAVTGLRLTSKEVPPAPPILGLELLASGGIGLVAAITDLVAVRLRRSALAGLPLLVLFSVPVASNASKNTTENIVFFCIGMAGYLAMLSADGRERLRLWGRLVTPWNAANPDEAADELGTGPSTRALAASGRRIGLAAVVLALFAPLLIPGLHAHKLLHGAGHGTGSGPGSGPGQGVDASVNPLVQMTKGLQQPSPTIVFTYTTTDPQPQYLVEYVLNSMTATQGTWVPPSSKNMEAVTTGHALPRVPGLVTAHAHGRAVRTTITMQAEATLGQSFLPVPYAAREFQTVPNNGLQVDPATLMIYSPLANLHGVSYTVDSDDLNPTAADFEAADAKPTGMGSYLTVPDALRSLKTLANQIVTTADTPYTEAVALQAYLRSTRFSYNVDATEPNNPRALYNFLTKSRTGYCQQFSFAMTVLARLLGIPARVAVGYDAGTSRGHGVYQVETSDEHAWTQLYFAGLGWTTWDPTPPGTGVGQTNVGPPAYTEGASTVGPGGQTSPGLSRTGPTNLRGGPESRGLLNEGTVNRQADLGGIAPGTVVPATPGPSAAATGLPIALIVLASLLVIGLVAPRITRSWVRRRRWRTARDETARAHAAWAEMLDDLEDYGLRHAPGETPRTLAKRIDGQQRLAAPAREALNRIAQAEERASYAPRPGPAGTLTADVVIVRGAVAASVTSSARWKARLLPPSAAETVRRFLAHALDLFGWLELASNRVFGRLSRNQAEQN